MIDFSDAEKALDYLKSTDTPAAKAKCLYEALDDQKKTVLAIVFMGSKGGAGERAKNAEGSEEYINHLGKLNDARLDFETLRNKRKSAELQIEMWRSVNSNQRKGNI